MGLMPSINHECIKISVLPLLSFEWIVCVEESRMGGKQRVDQLLGLELVVRNDKKKMVVLLRRHGCIKAWNAECSNFLLNDIEMEVNIYYHLVKCSVTCIRISLLVMEVCGDIHRP